MFSYVTRLTKHNIDIFEDLIALDEEEEEHDCFQVVLIHEVEIFNTMLETTRELFESCRKAMLGENVVTGEVELVMNALTSNTILQQVKVIYCITHLILVTRFQRVNIFEL